MEPIASTITFVSAITTASLTLALTERAGDLFQQDLINVNVSNGKLIGKYADATIVTAAVSGGLSLMYLAIVARNVYKHKLNRLYAVMIGALLLSLACAIMVIILIEQWDTMAETLVITEPAEPPPETNFTLRGNYGIALLATASVTLATSVAAIAYNRSARLKGI